MRPSLHAPLLRRWPFLGLAALLLAGVLLALLWTGTGPADAQSDELQVAITASPANPVVEETVRFRAIISNRSLGRVAFLPLGIARGQRQLVLRGKERHLLICLRQPRQHDIPGHSDLRHRGIGHLGPADRGVDRANADNHARAYSGAHARADPGTHA